MPCPPQARSIEPLSQWRKLEACADISVMHMPHAHAVPQALIQAEASAMVAQTIAAAVAAVEGDTVTCAAVPVIAH